MRVTKAHKIKLNPTPEQEQYFWQAAGVARYAFNWGLDRWNLYSEYNWQVKNAGIGDKISISGRLLKKEFNRVKPEWVGNVTCWAYQGAFDDLQSAFRNFFEKSKKGLLPKSNKPRKDKKPNGWPRFKSKKRSLPCFYLANSSLRIDGYNIQFDKGRVGWVNMTEEIRFNGKILGGRISYSQGCWWLSVQVETEHQSKPVSGAVGVDLGIKYLAVTSDGVIYNNPKALKEAQAKLRRLQRKLDRQRRANNPDNFNPDGTAKKNVKNWVVSNKMKKTQQQITKVSTRIANIRQEASHQMTTEIANTYQVIGVEDLNLKGMMKNHRLAQAIGDAALFEKRRQLEYKTKWNGGEVVQVNRWFPSSKICSECGFINAELTLSVREWTCPECKTTHHRDGNAAVNIRNEALKQLNNNSPVLPGSDSKAPMVTQAVGSNVVGEPTH